MENTNYIEDDTDSPLGSWREGYVREEADSYVASYIWTHAYREWNGNHPYPVTPVQPTPEQEAELDEWHEKRYAAFSDAVAYLTIHLCWSGYSEYTITNNWSEVTYEYGPITRHFRSVPHFFAEMFDARDSVDEGAALRGMREMTQGV